MKYAMRRVAALICALCMLSTAMAENVMPDLDAMLPLVDLTVAAALRVDEIPENILPEETLSKAWVSNFFLMGKNADASLGITQEMLSDPAQQAAYLANAFTAQQPSLETIAVTEGNTCDYIGLQIMASDMDDAQGTITLYGDLYQAEGAMHTLTEEQRLKASWLSWRAVVTLHQDAQAPGGWKIDSCTFEPAIMLDGEGQDLFQESTVEYVNAELGFSVQYPAAFTEDTLEESAAGMTATLKDGNAVFRVSRTANTQGLSLDDRIQQVAGQYADATAAIHEVSQTGRVTGTWANGFIGVTAIIVTDSWIYEAQLSYAPEKADTFAMYSEYMINSFMVDELGIG